MKKKPNDKNKLIGKHPENIQVFFTELELDALHIIQHNTRVFYPTPESMMN